MKISPRQIVIAVSLVLCFGTAVFAQRTSGDLEGKVTDPNGAVVPNVSVTLTGVTVGFKRTVQSDDQGEFRIKQVPIGTYKITTAALSGFAAATLENIDVTIEKVTIVNVKLGLTATTNVVDVSASDAAGVIDPTDSKVQTNITSRMIEQLPKGTSFNSLLRLSPATRPEGLSGGFQVDGASGSENSFLIDGLSVENFRTGVLNGVNNIPTELVSQIQIKTGGFEAEHGGASGAVISVVTRGGNDKFHGDFGAAFEVSGLQPSPRFAESRFVSSSSSAAAIAANPDITYAIANKKDDFDNLYPSGTVSGPIVKKRVWFLASYSPQIFTTTRTSNFINAIANSNFTTGKFVPTPRLDSAGNPLAPITYRVRTKNEYAFGRVDAQFYSKLRGGATYLWNPAITHGNLPFANITTSQPVDTAYGGGLWNSAGYASIRGGRNSSNNFTSHLEWTPNNKWVVTARYGRAFQNEKAGNYAIPEGVRSICSGSATAYASIATGCPGGIGYQNLSTNSITSRDVSLKHEFSADASYVVTSLGGNHDFKGGYLRGQITNNVLNGNAGTGTVQLFYGQDFAQALPAAASLKCTLGSATCIGVGSLNRSGTKGIGQNLYQGIYFQDRWQPTSRLSLNLGVRFEKELVPSFNAGDVLAGSAIPSIEFGWGKKIAPRLGGAYDLFGDGKTKIYGSYGFFYDRLKFEAPRGSFGGDFFRVDYFPITAANPTYSFYTPDRILGSWTDPRGGGNPSTAGGLSQLQIDFRIPSNLTEAQFKALGLVVTGVDPDLKAFQQREFTIGFEREIRPNWVLSGRFTRKNVAHAQEDHAILGLNQSENYPVGNPGEGLDLKLDQGNGTARSAKPQRLYRAFEIVLNKRLDKYHYYFNANYTLGYLFGNYSGLASSDEGGRTSPAVDRFFDYPINGFTATGQPDNGYLATDRRHVFKSYGGYEFTKWKNKAHWDNFSFFYQAMQGTPQTTFVTVVATSIPLIKRGDLGRTPMFSQTDLAWTHNFKFGEEGRYTASFDFNVLNVFNQNTVTSLNTTRYRTTNTIGAKDIDPTYDAATQTLIPILNKILTGQIATQLSQLENGGLPSLTGRPNPHSSLYGKPNGYQSARSVRFGFRFSF